MKNKLEAHRNAFLLAFALTAFIIGAGGIQVASAYDDDHVNYVQMTGLGLPWGFMVIETTAYNSGTQLGSVTVSQDCDTYFPLSVYGTGTGVAYLNSQQKLAYGTFSIYTLIFLFYTPTLYTEITYIPIDDFRYQDWWEY